MHSVHPHCWSWLVLHSISLQANPPPIPGQVTSYGIYTMLYIIHIHLYIHFPQGCTTSTYLGAISFFSLCSIHTMYKQKPFLRMHLPCSNIKWFPCIVIIALSLFSIQPLLQQAICPLNPVILPSRRRPLHHMLQPLDACLSPLTLFLQLLPLDSFNC